MGSLFGGSLFEGGADVTLIDLDVAHVESIRKNGLNLKTDAGERRIHVPVLFPSEVNAVYDLVIVFTKAMHTKQALSALRSAIGPNTALLSLQNGLDNKLVLTEFADPRNVLIGITTYPADIKGPGQRRISRSRRCSACGSRRTSLTDAGPPTRPLRAQRAQCGNRSTCRGGDLGKRRVQRRIERPLRNHRVSGGSNRRAHGNAGAGVSDCLGGLCYGDRLRLCR